MTTGKKTGPSSVHAVETAFDAAAERTRARIRQDRNNGLEAHEETLTQNLVSSLTMDLVAHGLDVVIKEVPRYEEAHAFGADIFLWFENPDGRLAGIHLQAKRQYPDDSYRDLDHSNASVGAQYDLLVDGAALNGAIAAYAFYNGLEDHQPMSTACSQSILRANAHGVNVALAKSLKDDGKISSKVKRTQIERLSVPLSCLVRCGIRAAGVTGPADALLNWGPVRHEQRALVSPLNAPGYLQSLLSGESARKTDSDKFEDVSDGDIFRQIDAGPEEGGAFLIVMLARARRIDR